MGLKLTNRITADLKVIVPNLNWRYSGVTATNRMIVPLLAKRLNVAWLGFYAPDGVARMTWRDLLALLFRRPRNPVIWHARRNNEMMAGLLLKALGWPLRPIFTSAGQRHHTWITRALISRMDAVIAASEAAASYLKRPATVILHGIDTARYAPPADREAAFRATGLPGRYAIGCFGRVRHQKGTDVFVDAMCRLLPKYPDFTAVIVGAVTPDQQGFNDGLKRQVAAAGLSERVRFLGELDDRRTRHVQPLEPGAGGQGEIAAGRVDHRLVGRRTETHNEKPVLVCDRSRLRLQIVLLRCAVDQLVDDHRAVVGGGRQVPVIVGPGGGSADQADREAEVGEFSHRFPPLSPGTMP